MLDEQLVSLDQRLIIWSGFPSELSLKRGDGLVVTFNRRDREHRTGEFRYLLYLPTWRFEGRLYIHYEECVSHLLN